MHLFLFLAHLSITCTKARYWLCALFVSSNCQGHGLGSDWSHDKNNILSLVISVLKLDHAWIGGWVSIYLKQVTIKGGRQEQDPDLCSIGKGQNLPFSPEYLSCHEYKHKSLEPCIWYILVRFPLNICTHTHCRVFWLVPSLS